MLSQFLAECAAVQAEHGGGMALVVCVYSSTALKAAPLPLCRTISYSSVHPSPSRGFEKVPDGLLCTLSGGRGGVTRFWRLPGCARDADGGEFMRRSAPR